jgi:3-hydroxyisobutyrate dehydrogenase-like beta-hydroxyacid dehydrogenase
LKRPLRVLGDDVAPNPMPPLLARVGKRLVSVADTGDGTAARRFADELLAAGAELTAPEGNPQPDDRIVIRATAEPVEARLRAEALEETADVVLGSVRPAFAARFVAACARGVTS